jgi:hypothetical protein
MADIKLKPPQEDGNQGAYKRGKRRKRERENGKEGHVMRCTIWCRT